MCMCVYSGRSPITTLTCGSNDNYECYWKQTSQLNHVSGSHSYSWVDINIHMLEQWEFFFHTGDLT